MVLVLFTNNVYTCEYYMFFCVCLVPELYQTSFSLRLNIFNFKIFPFIICTENYVTLVWKVFELFPKFIIKWNKNLNEALLCILYNRSIVYLKDKHFWLPTMYHRILSLITSFVVISHVIFQYMVTHIHIYNEMYIICAKKSQLKLQEYVISSYHLITEIKFTLISLHLYVYKCICRWQPEFCLNSTNIQKTSE